MPCISEVWETDQILTCRRGCGWLNLRSIQPVVWVWCHNQYLERLSKHSYITVTKCKFLEDKNFKKKTVCNSYSGIKHGCLLNLKVIDCLELLAHIESNYRFVLHGELFGSHAQYGKHLQFTWHVIISRQRSNWYFAQQWPICLEMGRSSPLLRTQKTLTMETALTLCLFQDSSLSLWCWTEITDS